jgi:hypothetical protein
MSRITIHARTAHTKSLCVRAARTGTTYVGFIAVEDGPARWTQSTQMHRLTREDALADAAEARESLLRLSSQKG